MWSMLQMLLGRRKRICQITLPSWTRTQIVITFCSCGFQKWSSSILFNVLKLERSTNDLKTKFLFDSSIIFNHLASTWALLNSRASWMQRLHHLSMTQMMYSDACIMISIGIYSIKPSSISPIASSWAKLETFPEANCTLTAHISVTQLTDAHHIYTKWWAIFGISHPAPSNKLPAWDLNWASSKPSESQKCSIQEYKILHYEKHLRNLVISLLFISLLTSKNPRPLDWPSVCNLAGQVQCCFATFKSLHDYSGCED
jgi:hypothetical protein